MASGSKKAGNAAEIDRLALAFAKEPGSKAFIPLAEEYGKAGMWGEAVVVLEDGLKTYPGFITAMVALGRAYEQMNQPVKAKAILEEAVKLSPDNLRAHRTLAKLYAAEGAKQAVVRSCDVILSIHPNDQEALSLRAGFDKTTPRETAQSQEILRETPVKVERLGPDRLRGEGLTSPSHGTMPSAIDETQNLPCSVLYSEERHASTTDFTGQALQKIRNPIIAQLEQWLNSVQMRRRSQASSPPQLNSGKV